MGHPQHIERGRSIGVIYVAIGARFVCEAAISAESVRHFLPDVPLVLFTDQELDAHQAFDEIIRLQSPHPMAHINKLIAMAQSPFEETLLLDTDTYVCADISGLFAMLDRFDIAATHSRPYLENFPKETGVPDAFVEFSQGVVAFRRSAKLHEALRQSLVWADKLHARWAQPPLRIALFHSDVRIATLPPEYNCIFAGYGYLNGVVRILHGRIPNRQMESRDYSRIARTLNRITVPRVFVHGLVLAMSKKNFLGRAYWRRTVVGHLYWPSILFLADAFAAVLRHWRDGSLGGWLLRLARRAILPE